MAGIYIHIPFCRQKCHYCNFFSVASSRNKTEFIDALLKEISIRKEYVGEEEAGTIYLGGGTPSLLPVADLNRIFEALHQNFRISGDAEITLEANPDDISPDWARELHGTPINRLSIGIQSFFDEDLTYLNRVHSAGQALAAIETVQDAGYENLTVDLIYGTPGLTMEKWRKNLDTFFSLSIPHLSAYALTVEPHTALHHLIEKKKMLTPDEMESVEHFRLLQRMAREHSFVHYEISNFSLPGRYSRHNSIYWLGGNYLGLGPSAHSFNGRSRQWNVSGLKEYILQAGYPERIAEVEYLTADQRYNEYVMTSLRTMWGCDPLHILNSFGEERRDYFLKEAEQFAARKWLVIENGAFFLTDEGKLFADGIASSLFMTTDD
jgi:oxygen-independent coproporphyrinogen-3 oxidase